MQQQLEKIKLYLLGNIYNKAQFEKKLNEELFIEKEQEYGIGVAHFVIDNLAVVINWMDKKLCWEDPNEYTKDADALILGDIFHTDFSQRPKELFYKWNTNESVRELAKQIFQKKQEIEAAKMKAISFLAHRNNSNLISLPSEIQMRVACTFFEVAKKEIHENYIQATAPLLGNIPL